MVKPAKIKRSKLGFKRDARKKGNSSSSKLPNSFKLTADSFLILRSHWQVFGGIMLVYLFINALLGSGLSRLSSTVSDIRGNIEAGTSGLNNRGLDALDGYLSLLTGGNSTSSMFQTVLIILVSLTVIWELRQFIAGKSSGVKKAYYRSMYPLIPFLLVLLVIIIQLLPLTVGAIVLAALTESFPGNDLASVAGIIVFLAALAWSVRMLGSSIFALYIVTLPDMEPRKALRSAKDLVRSRRLSVLRKLLFLPLFVFVVLGLFFILTILIAAPLATAVFYLLSALAILYSHTYIYGLYRSML